MKNLISKLAALFSVHSAVCSKAHVKTNFKTTILAIPVLLTVACTSTAQPPGGGFGGPAQSAQEQSPYDITGYWVALVTEDWRFRMMTAPAGDYQGVPLSQAGQEVANAWNPDADQGCLAYGAGGLMRMPTRLHITWEDENVLRIDTDAGRQTRLLKFGPAQDGEGAGTLQGVSNASWELSRAGGFGSPVVAGSLAVTTTDMSTGYYRTNGVPYSEQSVLTEHFEHLTIDSGEEYLTVISILNDPVYMTGPVLTSSNFKRQEGRGGWNPTDCE